MAAALVGAPAAPIVFTSNILPPTVTGGKENSNASSSNNMYGAPASTGYFGVPAPLPLHLHTAQAQAQMASAYGQPLPVSKGSSSSRHSGTDTSGRRTASSKPGSSVAGMAPAPPSVRELNIPTHRSTGSAGGTASNELLRDVAAMRRAAAIAAAAGVTPITASVPSFGSAAQQQSTAGVTKKVPTPPEPRARASSGTSGSAATTAALGNNSAAAQARRRTTTTGSSSSASAAAALAAAQAQFDQFSLWNDAEPNTQDWAQQQRHSHAPASGRGAGHTHQLYPQPHQQPLQAQQPFTARPDSNFHHPSGMSQHRAAADAAAAARVESRAQYAAAHSKHGPSAAASAAAAAELSGVSAIDTSRANERVEKRFLYWKNFWSNIQQMRAKGVGGAGGVVGATPAEAAAAAAAVGIDVASPVQAANGRGTGLAGFGMHLGGGSAAAPVSGSSNSSKDAATAQQQAHLLGMSEAEFRAAMAEFNAHSSGADLPADIDVSYSEQLADPVASSNKVSSSPKRGKAAAAAAGAGANVSASTGATGPAGNTTSTSTAAGNPAAYAAFQAYQAQFSSGSPSKKSNPSSSSASVGRPPSASKKSSNIDAAHKFEQQQQQQREKEREREREREQQQQTKAATKAAAAAEPAPAGSSAKPSSGATAIDKDNDKPLSNVERFWAEEQARAGKPRPSHVGPGGVSKSKASSKAAKAALHFVAPEDTDRARDMWVRMKAELDDKWSKFSGAASPVEEQETQKPTADAARQPSQQQQQQHQQPSKPAPSGDSTARQPAASGSGDTSNNSNTASPSNRRASAYAFTNIRKEDLNVRAAPAAESNATAAAAAQPAAARGAQFSSFTRPPQPHTSSSANGGVLSAAHAAAVAAGKGRAFELYSGFSVRALRQELLSAGVSASELARLVEKDELVTRLLQAQTEGQRRAEAAKAEADRKAEARARAAVVEQSREQLRERIVHEVSRWAAGRNIKSMLNELNGLASLDAPGYLKRTDPFTLVAKSYKKTLLRIHPDKHMGGPDGIHDGKYLRATEVFKHVSQAFDEYKKKHDK